MGGNFMKLVSLSIKELYECYNYDITFNYDVTFIYGENGCGKTTVLNITEAIITGQLFKLFNYNFKEIKLSYSPQFDTNNIKHICINFTENNNIKIIFNAVEYEIERLNISEKIRNYERTIKDERNIREVYRYYFERYMFLEKIRDTFNYVYLPLNRSNKVYDYDEDYYMMDRNRRNHIFFESDEYSSISITKDIAMIQIETLIRHYYSQLNSTITRYGDEFRNDILKSLLEVNRKYDFLYWKEDLSDKKNTVSRFQKTQTAYIKILKELKIINQSEEDNYNKFFHDFIEDFEKSQKQEFQENSPDLIIKFLEISKIENLVSIAEKMEQKKAKEREPVEIFLETMNQFINNSEDRKKIGINGVGTIYFTTKYSKTPISIQYLSSGEKQLITFFANLIFSVKSNTAGIFVVDEPELSLHLSWQKIFIEKTLEINKNIQLIFATHSPEIVGKNRSKMYKLEKKYIKVK